MRHSATCGMRTMGSSHFVTVRRKFDANAESARHPSHGEKSLGTGLELVADQRRRRNADFQKPLRHAHCPKDLCNFRFQQVVESCIYAGRVACRFCRSPRCHYVTEFPPRARSTLSPALGRLHPGSFSAKRVGSSQAKPEDTFQVPPAAAPATQAISAGYTPYAASYCATPRGACNLAERRMVGDNCWCITPAGQYANGTAE
jgi:hypothetical protein